MKSFLFFCIWLIALGARAAVPTFESFSTNQFQTNSLQVFYRDPHTNDAGIIYPALDNTLSLVTNLNTYGTFSLPAKVTLLALGTNYLDVTTNTTWLLNSPTNDATQVTLSLSSGAYQGQLLFITSQNGSNSFTLPDLSEQWDVPGAYVDIQGDWVGTTNRGIILQYTAPDWIEMARFDPGQTGGGTVFGSGTPTYIPYWLTPTTLSDSSLIRSNASIVMLNSTNAVNAGKFIIQTPSGSAFMDITGAGDTAHFQGGSIAAYIANANNRGAVAYDQVFVPTVDDTISLGSATSLRWKNLALSGHIIWNGATNSLFDLWGAGSPEGVITASMGSFYRDAANGTFYGKTNGVGNTGWGILLAGSGSAALWASAGGVLPPSPAIDLVRIESQLADNATNVALVVDTSVPWATGYLAAFRNQTTNTFGFLAQGGFVINGLSPEITGYTAAAGTPYFDITPDWLDLGSLGGGSLMFLNPTVASTGSGTAYLFDTSNVLTNGDNLAVFRNSGTNILTVGATGGTIIGTEPSWWGPFGPSLVMYSHTDHGYDGNWEILIGGGNDSSNATINAYGDYRNVNFVTGVGGNGYLNLYADAVTKVAGMEIDCDAVKRTFLTPGIDSGSASGGAYYFDTKNVLAGATDNLQVWYNHGTAKTSISKDGALTLGSVTKAQKTALTPANGMIVYQTDNTPGLRAYVNGTWFIVSTAADP